MRYFKLIAYSLLLTLGGFGDWKRFKMVFTIFEFFTSSMFNSFCASVGFFISLILATQLEGCSKFCSGSCIFSLVTVALINPGRFLFRFFCDFIKLQVYIFPENFIYKVFDICEIFIKHCFTITFGSTVQFQ